MGKRCKVVGVGLNKTGTKTLASYLTEWGYRNRSYDMEAFGKYRDGEVEQLLDEMEKWDSFEDWPWPLMYREIAEKFPDAKFILTLRKSPEVWYRSLCQMAIRRGPLVRFEKYIYGYGMPQGQKEHHISYYEKHQREVEEFFGKSDRDFLVICWENGDSVKKVAEFLGEEAPEEIGRHKNRGSSVYAGENLYRAHFHRILFQGKWFLRRRRNRFLRRLKKET